MTQQSDRHGADTSRKQAIETVKLAAAVARAEAAERNEAHRRETYENVVRHEREENRQMQVKLAAAEAQVAAWDAEIVRLRGALRDIATGRLPEHPRFLATERAIREYARAALAAQPTQGPTRLSGKTATRAFALSQVAAQPTPPEPETPKLRRCNRHADCDVWELENPESTWITAHCHVDDCEDCYGK